LNNLGDAKTASAYKETQINLQQTRYF